MLLEIARNLVEAITKYHNTLDHIEVSTTIRTRTGNEYHIKDNDRSADVVAKRGGIIRILLLLETRRHGIVGSRDNVPPNVSSSFTGDRSIFPSMLSPARDLLAPVMLAHPLAAPAALLGDDLDFSLRHSEGISMTHATTSLNALADTSIKRHPARAANAAGTC